jgi:HD-GYP domain-containing protein (c-di-GMP phosphodiesterase class II)
MSKMVMVPDLAPGDTLDDEVLSPTGRVLLGKGVEITPRHIALLDSWNVQSVFIKYDGPDISTAAEDKNDKYNTFIQSYKAIDSDIITHFDHIRDSHIIPVSAMKDNASRIDITANNDLEIMNHLLATGLNPESPISSHALQVAYYADLIAHHLDWNEADIAGVTLAGLLHDIGTLILPKLPSSIREAHLDKAAILLKLARGLPAEVLLGIIQHREYINGTGLPQHTPGERIHPYAKVIAIADLFHSMSSGIDGANPFPALDILHHGMYEKFDPAICQTFIDFVKDSLIMNKVMLSDGKTADVVFFNKTGFRNPIIKTADGQLLDLANEPNLKISHICLSNTATDTQNTK